MRRTNRLVQLYRDQLLDVKGITLQKLHSYADSSYKAMSMVINEREFGMSRDALLKELAQSGIQGKVYFKPLHHKKVYARFKYDFLPNTDFLYHNIISLPLYSHMPKAEVKAVCLAIKKIAQQKNSCL